jgi:hypothetical protein
LTLGRQGPDGMSTLSGLLDPEARSYVEALFATWAAPGSCNPDDDTPTVAGDPTEDAVRRDHRTPAQRHHDAIKAAIRGVIAGGQLGTKNGLPVTVIVSTTLAELQSGCGKAGTGGGSVLPMSDLIRMASHSYHCLVIFDDTTGRPLYLGRTKRIASPDQRIVLHAKDRGCTHPGCTVPGYLCEVHHVDEWVAHEGTTDVDKLTLTCRPHHRLVRPGGWTTRKRRDGRTEWIPPPHLDHGQTRINNYHHPENYLTEDGDTGT